VSEVQGRIIETLRALPVLTTMPAESIAILARGAEWVEVPPRTRISSWREPAAHLYVLVEGAVRVFHQSEEAQVTVKHLAAPCTFGEKEILARSELVECTESLEACRLIRIPAELFLEALGDPASPSRLMLEDVCRRFCIAIRNERALISPLSVRLASMLIAFAEWYGRDAQHGVLVRLPLTQQDLADSLGVGLRTVSRVVTEWTNKGWLAREKGWLVIRDIAAVDAESAGLRSSLNYRTTPPGVPRT
jgi:CRP-like cAMP-binding protein